MNVFFRQILLSALALALLSGATPRLHAAEASITIDAQTGYILDQREADKKRQIGSLTKIATAMVVLDWSTKQQGDLAQVAVIQPAALVGSVQNNIGFQPGDTITLRDLLYAALVQSDNIAANALAEHVGRALLAQVPPTADVPQVGPVDYFVRQMNALAQHLGMQRTRFLNPSGTDNQERPYSTAADVARLTRYAMENAGFRFYVSQKEREIEFGRGPERRRYLLRNTNELLGRENVDGVKTGMTQRAGSCLALSAAQPSEVVQQGTSTLITPRRLIVVLLDSPDRFGEGAAQLARGWELYNRWAAAGRPLEAKRILGGPNE